MSFVISKSGHTFVIRRGKKFVAGCDWCHAERAYDDVALAKQAAIGHKVYAPAAGACLPNYGTHH